jgi:hypothetical protein
MKSVCRFCGKEFDTHEEMMKHVENAQVRDVLQLAEEHWK